MVVQQLLDYARKSNYSLHLTCIAGTEGLNNTVSDININRPGLSLTGYDINFASGRIQVFGKGETGYLEYLETQANQGAVHKFFEKDIPCTLFTHGLQPPAYFIELANQYKCPVIQCKESSSQALKTISRILDAITSPSQVIHGEFVEVFGVGVLILGDSGAGKSEAALALIERGHLLIGDDVVKVTLEGGKYLVGRPVRDDMAYHMEIRGLGIINIRKLFGVGAITSQQNVELAIELEHWDEQKSYDRIGIAKEYLELFGVSVPKILLPIRPGRDITVIIETAVRNFRLQSIGIDGASEFTKIVRDSLNKPKR